MIRYGIATRTEINVLYPNKQSHPNDKHRDAIRALIGQTNYTAADGTKLGISNIRQRIGVIQRIAKKVAVYFESV